ncbi:Polyketide synthase involved in xenocoumacin synthesis [Xenorhabdus nematophila F1]|uniref:type I polyketide synthase n=1 Tax=Xenorhabdus nematophila TaxID=628 RepID=UPI00032752A7|nr:type I polyketide synthase [Xenorhabdus nematophila]CCW30968.1 Polyketide synthase involved in xenocoumacin synthesis [Xenorhabdus nematophila F1]
MVNNVTGLEVAIVGMAGQFPGADNVHDFWEMLCDGKEGISRFTQETLENNGISPEEYLNEDYVPAKGIINKPYHFAADYFAINHPDAEKMDPQTRLMIETCWQALNHAGIDAKDYPGEIGVYAGAGNQWSWFNTLNTEFNSSAEQFHVATLNDSAFCSRISYLLNLRGPSVTIQTACSTSLVAVHTACQALQAGECDIALAGGVSVTHPHQAGYRYQEGMINSIDGKTRVFDEQAGGTVFSNGVGVVTLKRLTDAIEDNDRIYAVIKGSAINNDGNDKISFTAPSALGQEKVIRAALNVSEIDPASISYIETHGTGTVLGDPIEIAALDAIFHGQQSCAIGSVKSNVGHCDTAAGVISLIKLSLCVYFKTLVPSINFEKANKKLALEKTPFHVNTQTKLWVTQNNTPINAGVSAFGVGGTNAHLVLQEFSERTESVSAEHLNYQELPNRIEFKPAIKKETASAFNEEQDNEEQEVSVEFAEKIDINAILKEILNVLTAYFPNKNISKDDNFFDVGASSLDIVQLHEKINAHYAIKLSINDLYRYTTCQKISEKIYDVINEMPRKTTRKLKKVASGKTSNRIKTTHHDYPENAIAVVGISGRFPGSHNVREYWKNILSGKEGISFFTDDELIDAGIPEYIFKNKHYVRAKGIVENALDFDKTAFGYTMREAQYMDPQFRLLHEITWEVLDDAGYGNPKYRPVTGLFASSGSNYEWLDRVKEEVKDTTEQFSIGLLNDREFLTTRIAYKLNLTGPAVTVQSACSSSALAITLACQSLRVNQCDLALAGGVSITVPVKSGYMYVNGMVNSADGHCKPFSEDASGTVFSDGIGMVALKRLEDAIENNDHIYGVIAGYGVNNDGYEKAGFTAPSANGQAACIKQSLAMAGISANDVGYLEAHGTATLVGDDIELEGVKSALSVADDNPSICHIGSVKSNLGHTDSAAGVAGFIKTLLTVKHKKIPPTCHTEKNDHGLLQGTRFRLINAATDWDNNNDIRTAGLSSFGIGGTNVHITIQSILEQISSEQDRPELITLSSKSKAGLIKTAETLGQFLNADTHTKSLSDIAYTLQIGRGEHEYRTSFVIDNVKELKNALLHVKETNNIAEISFDQTPGIVFMFPGQGAQYINMARDLYNELGIFRTLLDECHEYLFERFGINLLALLYDEKNQDSIEKLRNTQFTQPIIFAISYSLAKSLEALGVEAKAMIGHSIGEYVAAAMAGVMTLDEALELVAVRGLIMQECEPGAMLSVSAGREEIEPYLTDEVTLATVNSSTACVIAGPQTEVEKVQLVLADKNYRTRLLETSHAFHTAMMRPAVGKFKQALKKIKWRKPNKAYISNVTGQWITAKQANSIDYWVAHLCETVEFHQGIMTCLEQPDLNAFIEVGPGRTLSTFVKQIIGTNTDISVINVMRHPLEKENDRAYLLKLLGQLWMKGYAINWSVIYQDVKPGRVSLPGYQFISEKMGPGNSPAGSNQAEKITETRIQKNTISDWLYGEIWQDALLPDKSNQSEVKTALCFVPNMEWCEPLSRHLNVDEKSIRFVLSGDDYTSVNNVITLAAGEVSHFEKLFHELKENQLQPDSVIFAWPLSGHRDLKNTWFSAITLLQAWATVGNMGDFRLLLVNTEQPESGMLKGLVKVITQEVSKCHPRLVQINTTESIENTCEILTEELLATDGRFIVCRTDGRCSEQVYERLNVEPQKKHSLLKQQGTYLITGGLGDLGLLFAEYLLKEYQATVILSGRRELPDRHEWQQATQSDLSTTNLLQQLNKLADLGRGNVVYYPANVADKSAMQRLLQTIDEQHGVLNGIICAAGVTEGDSFQGINRITLDACSPQIETKVEAYKILAELTEHQPLDFCLLCSSIASMLGGLSFSAYSSVSAFADAFARQQNQQGKLWISINWDGWVFERNDSGDALGSSLSQLLIEPDEGIQILERVLQSPLRGQIIVSTGDLNQRFEQWVGSHLKAFDINKISKSHRKTISKDQITETIISVWKDFLKITQINREDNFFELGANSLDLVQVNKRLTDALDIDISVVDMFSYPTSELLADYITSQYGTVSTNDSQYEQPDHSDESAYVAEYLVKPDTVFDKHIAIVGMAGKFPGAEDIYEFWDNLCYGKESISIMSKEELIESGIDSDLLDDPNYVRAKGIMPHSGEFDAEFFGYTPYEARQMDPQVRAMHICSWQALQDAGISPKNNKLKIGLYTAASGNLPWLAQAMATAEGSAGQYSAMVVADKDYMSTSVSYKLNLSGPSMVISTACSSSLVAVNEAIKSLRTGECDVALAGGVSITLPIKAGYLFEEGMIYSKDGKCRPFDIQANGTVFSDGVGVVVLKPLKQAIADKDNIYATIIGSGINNDGGMKVGYTAPSTKGQVDVIQAALRDANVSSESIHFVETHGTGTNLGDPIEFNALKQAFSTDKKSYCRIGSVKSNIGHLNFASGVTGLIKAALSIKNKVLPPTLHFARPNKEMDIANSPFMVNNQYTELHDNKYPIRAGVSSFGLGGTNVHLVLEEYRADQNKLSGKNANNRLPLILSAPDEKSLQSYKKQLKQVIQSDNQKLNISDFTYSLMQRETMASQFIAVVNNRDELINALSSTEKDNINLSRGIKRKVVFLFPGQGSQYIAMGQDLYKNNMLFKQWCDKGFVIAKDYCTTDLKALLINGSQEQPIYETEFVQPLLFIIEYALAQVLQSYDITPDAMIGHSLGEYVAATLAGVFSYEDVIKIICIRGRYMQSTETAAMLSVMASSDKVKEILPENLDIALDNSSELCVVAGSDEAMTQFEEICHTESIKTKRLEIKRAFHTRYMDPVLEEYGQALKGITLKKPQIDFISNVTGEWVDHKRVTESDYWVDHIRQPVRFRQSIATALENEHCLFIEVGPGRGLSTLVQNHSDYNANHACLSWQGHKTKGMSHHHELIEKLAMIALYGIRVNWQQEINEQQPELIHLPPTPIRGKEYPTDIKRLQALFSGNPTSVVEETEKEEKINTNPISRGKVPESAIDQLGAIWKLILGIDKIENSDDFISLGGSSLSAVQVIAKAKEINLPININMLLSGKTLLEINQLLGNENNIEYKTQSWTFNEKFSPEFYPEYASCLYSAVREKLKHEHQLDCSDALMLVSDGSPLLGIVLQQCEKETQLSHQEVNFGHILGWPALDDSYSFSYAKKFFDDYESYRHYCEKELSLGHVVIVTGSDYYLPFSPSYGLSEAEYIERPLFQDIVLDDEVIPHAFVLVGKTDSGYQVYDGSFQYFGEITEQEFEKTVIGFRGLDFMQSHEVFKKSRPYLVITVNCDGDFPDSEAQQKIILNNLINDFRKEEEIKYPENEFSCYIGLAAIEKLIETPALLTNSAVADLEEIFVRWRDQISSLKRFLMIARSASAIQLESSFSLIQEKMEDLIVSCKDHDNDGNKVNCLTQIKSGLDSVINIISE